jgi:hypothetical protein
MYGQKQQKKQPTAKEHVEILLRFKIRFFLFSSMNVVGATLSSARLDFAIIKIKIATIVSELKYTNGDIPTTITVQNA